MSEMVPTGSKYTDDQRTAAAIQYAIEGNLLKVERDQGIPESTMRDWKDKEWWNEVIAKVREENDDKILANAAKIIELAQARTIEAMPQATAAQASIVGATWVDKGRLIRNQPTSIRADSETVKSLAAEFKALSRDHKSIKDSVVSDQ